MSKKNVFYLTVTVISTLILSCSSTTEKEKGGLLWEISGNGLQQPSYLFGTAHGGSFIASTYILDSIPCFDKAFSSVTQYIGERVVKENGSSYFNPNILPVDSTYAELLEKEDLVILDSILLKYFKKSSENINFVPSDLTNMIKQEKIFEIAEQMIASKFSASLLVDTIPHVNEYFFISKRTMDSHLNERAFKKGYSTVGLDDIINFQFEFYTDSTLTLKQQAEKMIDEFRGDELDNALSDFLFKKEAESLKNAYYAQDLNKIDSISVVLYSDSTYLGEKQRELLFERNIKWMEHIPSLIREQPSFIAVGIRHLPGKNGLIDLLRKEGFTVKPL